MMNPASVDQKDITSVVFAPSNNIGQYCKTDMKSNSYVMP